MDDLKRPECFDFAIDFLGSPEDKEIVAYVEKLEARVRELEALLERHSGDKHS